MPPTRKVLTLCTIYREGSILLGLKKRGWGIGRWNGFGGKVEQGESIYEAAIREVYEEVGLKASYLEEMCVFDFEYIENDVVLEVHVFKCSDFIGEPVEGEEMKPAWFAFDKLPWDQMWPSDILWLPGVLEGKKFAGRVLFNRPSTADYTSKIIEHEVKELVC